MNIQIRPILVALRQHKAGTALIALQIALTLAIVCNALFIINQRLANLSEVSGVDEGIRAVRSGAPLADIGNAIGGFARRHRYTLIENLASHGVGDSLHDEPREIPTWPDRSERRRIADGLVLTVEPFLSLGGREAVEKGGDPWTLVSRPPASCVQYEHTVVATKRGAIVVTL